MQFETDRLILRPFVAADAPAFAKINADPEVMRYFPAVWTYERTENTIGVFAKKWKLFGYAFSAVQRKDTGEMIGMCGLSRLEIPSPISPCTEIGWRLNKSAWGKGYATEAALAWLRWGFQTLDFEEIVSFTPRQNLLSQKVMQRIGMKPAPDMDFDHPLLEDEDPLKPMVVYKMTAMSWLKAESL